MAFSDRLQHAWNAFMNKDPTAYSHQDFGYNYSSRPDRLYMTRGTEKTIINAIYNRLSLDASAIRIEHVRVNEDGNFVEKLDSELNERFQVSANTDQTGRAMFQDAYYSMFDEGSVVLVPVETDIDPRVSSTVKILQLRVGKVVQWHPKHVMVRVYNEFNGQLQDITLPKEKVSIVENPFYAVMNQHNSTLQRLKRKLTLLDIVDEQAGSGKLDLIIQLPYSIKSDARRQQANDRRKDIEMQLTGSKYGIAYIDSTEHVTQLNRSLENNLLTQIKDLTETLYSQLGLTQEIMNGTADEKTMNNYYNRTIEPVLSAFVDEMNRKFLTKTARTQGQSIRFYRDPFKLVPTSELAELADKFTRNEIMTSNEFRQVIGMRPAKDPNADMLRNSNLSQPNTLNSVDVNGNPIANPMATEQPGADPMAVDGASPTSETDPEEVLLRALSN